MPTVAQYILSSLTLKVTFDMPLAPSTTIIPSNWIGNDGTQSIQGLSPGLTSNTLMSMPMQNLFPGGTTPRIAYNGGDPGLTGLTGLPVAAFSAFPLTVLP